MKLEPVYLVAPRRPLPNRRRFLWILLGATGGAAAGYCVGAACARGEIPAEEPGRITPINDRVIWARRLAEDDIRELWTNWDGFLQVLVAHGSEDPELWQGVMRLVVATTEGGVASPDVDRRLVARALASCIRRGGAPSELALDRYLPRLDDIGRRR